MVKPRNEGFSLIEMMIAFSIIFIAIGLLLPGLYAGKEQAVRIECANSLRQAAVVLNSWAKDHQRLPDNLNELVEEGYLKNLDFFKCSATGNPADWEYKAAGREVNDLKSDSELIGCGYCRLSVHFDGHVKFLKPRQRGGD
jgi:competence protein ComGC